MSEIWAWLDGFFFGSIVKAQCEFCSWNLNTEEIDAVCEHGGEETFVRVLLTHDCPVRSRQQVRLTCRRLWFWTWDEILMKENPIASDTLFS